MRMKSCVIMVTLCLLFAGCTPGQTGPGGAQTPAAPSHSPAAAVTPSLSPPPAPEPDPLFNPYNTFAHSDGDFIYFTNISAIYRMASGSSVMEKIVQGEAIFFIAIHGDFIYYRDNATLCRVSKDGGEPFRYHIDKPFVTVYCKGDTLYLDGYMTDVASDPDVLTLEEKPKGSIAPDGRFYFTESITPDSEVNSLYRSDENGEREEIINKLEYGGYFITDQFIFYYGGNGILKTDSDGKNEISVIHNNELNQASVYDFKNYDSEWIYLSGRDETGFKTMRIHQQTHAYETLNWTTPRFDVVDGYLYGIYGSKAPYRFYRMRLPDGEIEQLDSFRGISVCCDDGCGFSVIRGNVKNMLRIEPQVKRGRAHKVEL